MVLRPREPDATELLRSFRESYVNFYLLWGRGERVPAGTELATPESEPLSEEHVPRCARALLDRWRKERPEGSLEFRKYMRIEDGRLVKVIEGEDGLPGEGRLLTLSQTVTLVASGTARIVTETVVARVGEAR